MEENGQLHAELYDLHSSPKYYSVYQIKKTDLGRACRTYGRQDSCIQVLVRKPEMGV